MDPRDAAAQGRRAIAAGASHVPRGVRPQVSMRGITPSPRWRQGRGFLRARLPLRRWRHDKFSITCRRGSPRLFERRLSFSSIAPLDLDVEHLPWRTLAQRRTFGASISLPCIERDFDVDGDAASSRGFLPVVQRKSSWRSQCRSPWLARGPTSEARSHRTATAWLRRSVSAPKTTASTASCATTTVDFVDAGGSTCRGVVSFNGVSGSMGRRSRKARRHRPSTSRSASMTWLPAARPEDPARRCRSASTRAEDRAPEP